jgi:hypothetical protein
VRHPLSCDPTGARPWSGDTAIAIAVAQATQPRRPFTAPHVPPFHAAAR